MTADSKTILIILAAILVLLITVILILSGKRGLPQGEVIYDDLSHDGTPVKPFFSAAYGLVGKPDLIIRNGNAVIPVEIKSARAPERPYPSHVLQLAAYCLLIEEHYGVRPGYGIIRYRDRDFEVPFEKHLEDRLLALAARMREEDPKTKLPQVCAERRKCRHCGFSEICSSADDPGRS